MPGARRKVCRGHAREDVAGAERERKGDAEHEECAAVGAGRRRRFAGAPEEDDARRRGPE